MKNQRMMGCAVPDVAPAARESYWIDPIHEQGWQMAVRMAGRAAQEKDMAFRTADQRGGKSK